MKAFENTPITKERFVHHLREHKRLDAFTKGTYGDLDDDQNFKGCAVACSLRSVELELNPKSKLINFSNHIHYESFLGVPVWLARLEDTLFEGMSLEKSKEFPLQFGEAINVGSNLDNIEIPFICFILEQNIERMEKLKVKDGDIFDRVIQANKLMINAQSSKDETLIRSAAESAKSAAESAAEYAKSAESAESAESAWSARSARSAAESAAEYAKSAESAESAESAWSARSARSAAESAAWSAKSAESAWSARSAKSAAESAAWSAKSAESAESAFDKYADKLLELIKECK